MFFFFQKELNNNSKHISTYHVPKAILSCTLTPYGNSRDSSYMYFVLHDRKLRPREFE